MPPSYTNEAISETIDAVIRGDVPGLPATPGWCLTFVRLIIERALGWPSHRLYHWRTQVVERPAGDDGGTPWARDMERSLRSAGMELEGPRYGPPNDPRRYVRPTRLTAGDLLFRWDAAWPVGHVALYAGRGVVLESVDPAGRPGSFARGVTVLSPLGFWPVTTAVRFDPSKPPT